MYSSSVINCVWLAPRQRGMPSVRGNASQPAYELAHLMTGAVRCYASTQPCSTVPVVDHPCEDREIWRARSSRTGVDTFGQALRI